MKKKNKTKITLPIKVQADFHGFKSFMRNEFSMFDCDLESAVDLSNANLIQSFREDGILYCDEESKNFIDSLVTAFRVRMAKEAARNEASLAIVKREYERILENLDLDYGKIYDYRRKHDEDL